MSKVIDEANAALSQMAWRASKLTVGAPRSTWAKRLTSAGSVSSKLAPKAATNSCSNPDTWSPMKKSSFHWSSMALLVQIVCTRFHAHILSKPPKALWHWRSL